MTEVHPAYDPLTNSWYDEDGREAPTLAAYRSLLRRGEVIANYFPLGAQVDRRRAVVIPADPPKPPPPNYSPLAKRQRARRSYTRAPDRQVADIPWTEDEVLRLKDLHGQGLTTGQIGAQMGRSRNAIIGKLHRLSGKYEK